MPKLKTKRLIIGGCLILAVIILIIGGILLRHSHDQPKPVAGRPAINYQPATSGEKAESEQHKDALAQAAQQAKNPSPTPSGLKAVTPVITSAYTTDDQVVISADVGGVFEDGGTCTATLSQGTAKVTGTSQAFANATTTDCQTITIPRASVPTHGEWQIVVRYTSATAQGDSDPKTIEL